MILLFEMLFCSFAVNSHKGRLCFETQEKKKVFVKCSVIFNRY